MYILAGLGNPGKEYEQTRHNVGFNVVDYFALKNNIKINQAKFKALYGEGYIGGDKVVIIKPQTYMNLSGQSIMDAVQFYKIDIKNLIVVYDDISIPLGRIRIRPSGSDGGHNGVKSVIYLLESEDFPRVRVGIGEPKTADMINYVLGRFDLNEQQIIDDIIKVASDSLEAIIKNGIQFAMNKYNNYKHGKLLMSE